MKQKEGRAACGKIKGSRLVAGGRADEKKKEQKPHGTYQDPCGHKAITQCDIKKQIVLLNVFGQQVLKILVRRGIQQGIPLGLVGLIGRGMRAVLEEGLVALQVVTLQDQAAVFLCGELGRPRGDAWDRS